MNQKPFVVVVDPKNFFQEAAGRFSQLAGEAIAQRGAFCVALSGGSTPRSMYQILAKPTFARGIEWSKVHVFWGDERCVGPSALESNFRMASEALLEKIAIPVENVHRIRAELDPKEAAKAYEGVLTSMPEVLPLVNEKRSGLEAPRFDLFLLGMGEDGHTASLFPGSEAIHEERRLVKANWVETLSTWRVTQTALAINAAKEIMFLIAGNNKACRLKEVLENPKQPDLLPAQIVDPWDGTLTWIVDQEAAAQLQQ